MMHSVQNQVPGLVLVGKVWIRNQLSLNVFLKTLVITRLTRLRSSQRHFGTGMYFEIFSPGSAVEDFPSGASSFITRELYPGPSIRWLSFRNEPEYKCLF